MGERKYEVAELIARVCELVPRWSGDQVRGFEYLPAGYSSDNYQFVHQHGQVQHRYVLRLPIGPQDSNRLRLERTFYDDPGEVLVLRSWHSTSKPER